MIFYLNLKQFLTSLVQKTIGEKYSENWINKINSDQHKAFKRLLITQT
jgi:hypothetical protein